MDTKKVINQLLERHTNIGEMAEKLDMLPESMRKKQPWKLFIYRF